MIAKQPTGARLGHRDAPARILLHSHDSFGLGHLRRTMTIAEALRSALPGASILITTGSPCATHFQHQDGIDVVKLPSVTKDRKGSYVPRSLGRDLHALLDLRRRMLAEISRTFVPDLLLVDHQVLGLCDELDEVLRDARRMGTRTILGVRDIIDAPDVVAREWGRPRARQALALEYDRVCVYGAPEIFDPRREYPLPPELRERLEFVGYIARPNVPARKKRLKNARRRVLVTAGGGEDGLERIEAYLDGLALAPVDWDSTVVLGPLADPERARALKHRARDIAHVEIQSFHADLPHLLSKSDAVVSMAGYNSVVEILQSRVPAVLVPRSFPRREQLLRAERLEARGLVECCRSQAPADLRAAVERALGEKRALRELPPMDGCERLSGVARELLRQRQQQTAAIGRR